MNKHIVKHEYRNGVKLDIPIVWCGRSIPWNSEVLHVASMAKSDDACVNCQSAVIRKLKNKVN